MTTAELGRQSPCTQAHPHLAEAPGVLTNHFSRRVELSKWFYQQKLAGLESC